MRLSFLPIYLNANTPQFGEREKPEPSYYSRELALICKAEGVTDESGQPERPLTTAQVRANILRIQKGQPPIPDYRPKKPR